MKYKGYLINPSKQVPNLFYVATEGRGGKIPDMLSGLYTTKVLAVSDIDRYLNMKGKTDAKESSES